MHRAIVTLLALLQLAASETVSLEQAPAFASQRPCAQDCFGTLNNSPYLLAERIGCSDTNFGNDCFCRPDLQGNGDAYLQSCVNRDCSQNTLDTNSAISIYNAYCTGAGYLRTTPATTTSGTGHPPSTVTVTVTATVRVSSAQKRLALPLQDLIANLASFRRIGRG
jgi:hypothetical protein